MIRFLKLLLITGLVLFFLPTKSASATRLDLLAVGDATVAREQPTTNFGRDDLIVSGRDVTRQVLMKFNAANGVPDGATINRAYLKLSTHSTFCSSGPTMPVKVRRLISPWEEMTVNYKTTLNTAVNDAVTVNLSNDAPSGYRTWDVTNIVKRWVEDDKPDYGFQISYYNGSINCNTNIMNRERGWEISQLSIDYTPRLILRDVVAPVISQVTVEHLSTVAVDVHWTTNEPATTLVEFGTGGNYNLSSPAQSGLRTSHIARVDGLTQATTYNYRIIAVDAAGNKRIFDNQTFTTTRDGSRPHATPSNSPSNAPSTPPATPNSQAPTQLHLQNIISDVTGPTSARIKWWSRPTGSSLVFASKTAAANDPIEDYDPPVGRNDDVETHEVILQNLSPNTTYGFRVATRTTDNQLAVSDRNEFKTYAAASDPANDPRQQTNGSNNNSPNNVSDQFESSTTTNDTEDDANGDAELDVDAAKEAQQQVAQWLNQDGSLVTTANKATSPTAVTTNDDDASVATTIIWLLMRMWLFFVIILVSLIFFIYWLVKRRRKNKDSEKNSVSPIITVPTETKQ